MFREYGGDAKILIGANALGQLFLQFSVFIMPFYLRALGYDMSSMGIFKRRSWGKLRHHAFSISFGLGTIFNALGVLVAGFAPDFLMENFGISPGIAYRLVIALALLQFILVILLSLSLKMCPLETPA